MNKDDVLRLALEALEDLGMKHHENTGEVLYKETFTAIKAALEAKDEPVATIDSLEQEIYENTRQFVSLDVMEWMLKRYYTTQPQRKPLTDEEIGAILEGVNAYGTRLYTFARAIEAKLKEKNT